MLRTHTCGELNKNDIGKEITLCGWVGKRRDHGKLIFIDIRDRYGITQIVFIPKESGQAHVLAQDLRNEFVIKIKGRVNERPQGNVNARIPTGEIEVIVLDLEVLNSSLTPQFEIEEALDIAEETRLKYRYLDLRRKKAADNIIARHTLYRIIRAFLDKFDFVEFETPILTKSTPEGARDYLVPSRLNPGEFYALPQSPQLFKQIFMVSGMDRYYQIAKCFRDEDLRADRQPEFTQLDMEMSFITEEDIYGIMEQLMQAVFREMKEVEIAIPFPRITYAEAQSRYSTDKPDLRKEFNTDFAFAWIVDFPMFKFNGEEERWESEHHPFTAPAEENINTLEENPEKAKSRSYDLVLNGMELGSGSIRIHNQELQSRIFKIIGIDPEQAEKRFGFLLEAFRFGAPPHGGFAFGIDRLLTIITGESSIREVIAFPKTSSGLCPLTGAPSDVDEKQLKELGIQLRKRQ
ncbi:MAG: aspartate--tRNA ligase [Candidatus Omnitrophica bacterium]|nr:aspartate--tRNA ligase [Candidatus Omnitrophota bacterium]